RSDSDPVVSSTGDPTDPSSEIHASSRREVPTRPDVSIGPICNARRSSALSCARNAALSLRAQVPTTIAIAERASPAEIDVNRVFGTRQPESFRDPDALDCTIVDLRRDDGRRRTRIDEGID